MKDTGDDIIYNGNQPIHLEVTLLKVKSAFKEGFGVQALGNTSLYDEDGKFRKGFVQAFPVDPGAVLNLEIQESSLTMGAIGSVTVSNEFNILENFDFNNTIEYDIYIKITAFDPKLEEVGVSNVNNGFDLMVYVTNLENASRDYVDNVVQFQFEEAFVNALRSISLNTVVGNWGNQGVAVAENTQLGEFRGPRQAIECNVLSVVEHIYNGIYLQSYDGEGLFARYFPMYNGQQKGIIHSSSELPNVAHSLYDDPSNKGGETSMYDVLQHMLQESLVTTNNAIGGKCAYMRMVNATPSSESKERLTRQMLFAPFVSKLHEEFMHELRREGAEVNTDKFAGVFTEKFSFGPFAAMSVNDRNTTRHNLLETYNSSRADVAQLKNNVWGNYILDNTAIDSGIVGADPYYFSKLQATYVNNEFGGAIQSVNIPILNDGSLKTFNLLNLGGVRGWDANGTNTYKRLYNYAYSKIAKSFLTIGETITFETRGSMIRQPNKFIWLERTSKVFHDDSPGNKNGLVDKLAYVNRVKHIWDGQTYRNEIQASIWTGNNDIANTFVEPQGPPAPQRLQQEVLTPPTGGVLPPTGGVLPDDLGLSPVDGPVGRGVLPPLGGSNEDSNEDQVIPQNIDQQADPFLL